MDQKDRELINHLSCEVSCMDEAGRKWLQGLWRERYGYTTVLASIEEMAIELGRHRNLFKF